MTNLQWFSVRHKELREKLVWNKGEAEEYRRLSRVLAHGNRIAQALREAKGGIKP